MSCQFCAGMAELADAQASGACGSNVVRVQVPFPASEGAKRNICCFRFAPFIFCINALKTSLSMF